jgi:hypothetical protein
MNPDQAFGPVSDSSNSRNASWIVGHRIEFALILAVGLVNLPMLLNKGLFWEDWLLGRYYWRNGFEAFLSLYWEYVRPLIGVILGLLFEIGGEYAGVLARCISLCCVIASACLLFSILERIPFTKDVAFWSACIFVLSPFYFMRNIMLTVTFDIAILSYIFSIWLSQFADRRLPALGIVALVSSFTLESLVCLEVLRVIYVSSLLRSTKKTIGRCLPYWITVGAFALSRLTWFKPSGAAEGHNAMAPDIANILHTLWLTKWGYIENVKFYLWSSRDAFGFSFVVICAVIGLLLVAFLSRRLVALKIAPQSADFRLTLKRLALGLGLWVLGSIPLILVGGYPFPGIGSRKLFAALPGISITLASLAAGLPTVFLRSYVMLALVGILTLNSVYVNKWFLFESFVKSDLVRQIYDNTAHLTQRAPQFLLRFTAEGEQTSVFYRAWLPDELTVPVNQFRPPEYPHIYIMHDRKAKEWTSCGFFRDRLPCPDETLTLEYRLRPDKLTPKRIPYWRMVGWALGPNDRMPVFGDLSVANGWPEKWAPSGTRKRFEIPPNDRAASIAAGILRLK